MKQKIYIILVNYNGYEDTIECLESLEELNYTDYQIIIVDNNSSDNSVELLSIFLQKYNDSFVVYQKKEAVLGGKVEEKNLINPVVLIDAKENKGFAAGNNIAMKYALSKNDFEYIWLLNNDTVIDKDSLKELVLGIEKYDNLGAVGSKILYYDKQNLLQNIGSKINEDSFFKLCKPILNLEKDNIDMGQYDYDFEVNDIMGASLLVKKEILNKIGFMPEEYFLYGEETDWNFNIQKHGYKLMTMFKSKVYHKKSRTTGGDDSLIALYYRTRNQFILNKKYMSKIKFIIFIYLFSLKKIFQSLRMSHKNRIIIINAIFAGLKKSGTK